MSNSLHWPLDGSGRRLLLALLLSILVHAWLAGGLAGWLPGDDKDDVSLMQVELAALPAPKPVPPAPLEPVPKRQPVEQPAAELPAPPASQPPVQPEAAPEPAAPVAAPEPPAPVAVEPPAPASPPVVAEEFPVPPPAAEEPPPKVPYRVEIDYQVVRKGGVAAVERHRYLAKEDGSYTLSSIAEPKGLLALALSNLVQRSEGRVTEHGLKPSSFVYHYGKNPDKAQKATFDWEKWTLALEVGSRRQTVDLEEGTQDLLSFMYQFMFVPPLQEMQLAVTNGKKLKVYNYGFEGEETLATSFGAVRTLRIGKSGSGGEEKTEIWLAADYYYLPVKISKTEEDGTVTSRIATRLQAE